MHLFSQDEANKILAVSRKEGIAEIVKVSHRHRYRLRLSHIHCLSLLHLSKLNDSPVKKKKSIRQNVIRIISYFSAQLSGKIVYLSLNLSYFIRYFLVQNKVVRKKRFSVPNHNRGLIPFLFDLCAHDIGTLQ